jgi:hypothetical protein
MTTDDDAPMTPHESEIRACRDAASSGRWIVWTSMDNTRDILSEAAHPAVWVAGLYAEARAKEVGHD